MAETPINGAARELLDMPAGRRRTAAAVRALLSLEPQQPATAIPTAEAIAAFQERAQLQPTGEADDTTVRQIVVEVAHQHVVTSRMRTANVQNMLARAGFPPQEEDRSSRVAGDSTIDAVKRFQEVQGLTVDGLVGDKTISALREAALAATLSTKRQTYLLQRKIRRAAEVRGLDVSIDSVETKSRVAGPSTQAAVRALQTSLGLPATGTVDAATFERISSVAASRRAPAFRVAAPDPTTLTTVPRQLRLNAINKHVPTLQRALAFVGHAPVESEFKAARFGPSTRKAVMAFQRANNLPESGAADGATLRLLNQQIRVATPGPEHSVRIRGCVRDRSWIGRDRVTVELTTDPAIGDLVVLSTRTTLANGFYDMPYSIPKDPSSGKPISPLALQVRFIDTEGTVIGTRRLINPSPVAWVNFTEGPYPYRGLSLHEAQLAAVRAAGVADVQGLEETPDHPQITRVAQVAGLTQDDLMRLVLSSRAASELGGQLDAEVCFAFLAQSLPSSLPDDLLAQSHEWTLIDQLTDLVAASIAALEPNLAKSALEGALNQNLVPITLASRLEAVLSDLATARRRFALERPLLVGNASEHLAAQHGPRRQIRLRR
jgi:peptidoglycan hydrolase-like protein with peptidoglycan-binding domain